MVTEATQNSQPDSENVYDEEDAELGGSMTFLEHLTELRERMIRSLIALLIAVIICFSFSNYLLYIFKESAPPEVAIQVITPPETIITQLKISVVGGLFIAFPVIFYQAWMFIAPGLYKRERRIVLPLIFASWICFIVGGLFCYFVVFKFTLAFLESITPEYINSEWRLSEYVSFSLRFILAFGLVFEEPVIILLLARIGLVTQSMLWKFFPYAVVIMFTLAALITPPDPLSQLMCAVPLIILYLFSVTIVHFIEKKKEEEAEESA